MLGWKRQQDAATVAASGSATRTDIIPGQLSALCFQHELTGAQGPIPCHTYLTDGLLKFRHPEVCVTLLRQAVPYPAQEPLQFFSTLAQLAQQGKIVRAGGFTQFGTRKFFGRHLAYLPAQPLAGIPIPANSLLAISVTERELQAIQSHGMLRVIARLGEQARYYPCPPWLDPNRPEISFAETLQDSLLGKMPRINALEMRILRTPAELVLRLSPSLRAMFTSAFQQLSEDSAVAFLTGLDPAADGCLVWRPGQTEACAISPPNSQGAMIGACFVIFLSQQQQTGGKMVEDGFAIFLKTEQWRIVRQALTAGQSFQLNADPGMVPVRFEWDQ